MMIDTNQNTAAGQNQWQKPKIQKTRQEGQTRDFKC